MERFRELREFSRKKIKIAEHLLTVTYPMVNDPKLLLAVIEKTFSALDNAMSAMLHYDLLFKRIPPFREDFDSKFNLFKARCMRRYNISMEHVDLIQKMRDIIKDRRDSPVEFVRKNKFVICSDTYRIKTISIKEMRNYLDKAKIFIEEMIKMVSKNDGIFK